ncbi:MAG: redox-regulated ATPase YchF [bacterium]|nr:redox-regulated ATPase YchF [bacterium]
MSLSIGIVGLPNVGKSTLFKALTKKQVDIQNYPFCTIDPNVGVVKVPDERLNKLAEFSRSQKTIPAAVEFVDIAGLVKGAAEGEGLGNKFLANIREVDAICEVVRIFSAGGGSASGGEITHIYNSIDPIRDIGVIETELILADLETASKSERNLEREVRARDKEAIKKMEAVKKIKEALERGEPARKAGLNEDELALAQDLHLLTFKPVLYVFNVSEMEKDWKLPFSLPAIANRNCEVLQAGITDITGNDSRGQISNPSQNVALDIKLEEDLLEMSEEDKKELEIKSDLDKLIVEAYKMLGLMTYFTTGEDETRAWTIKKNSTAPEAGAAIHTDFQEKFIRADVVNWKDLLDASSYAAAREKGLVRTEGKEYIVKDGDVIEFKI